MAEEVLRHLKWLRDTAEPVGGGSAQEIYWTNVGHCGDDAARKTHGPAFLAIAAYCTLVFRIVREPRFVLAVRGATSTDRTVSLSVNLEGAVTFRTLIEAFKAALTPGNEHGTGVVSPSFEQERKAAAAFCFGHPGETGNANSLTGFSYDSSDGLRLGIRADRELMNPSTGESLALSFRALFLNAAKDLSSALSDCEWLPEEQLKTLAEWRAGPIQPDPGHSIVSRFHVHARQQPTCEAVIADDGILTYSELERQSAQIAQALQLAGAKPADIIAVSHGRTANLICALLGVLAAGCAYCPIDPRLPSARIEQMIARSGARIVLVAASSRTAIPASFDGSILCVDELLTSSTNSEADCAGASPSPQHPAYLLFTSGSTGTPKGVLLEHSSLSNFLSWAEAHFGKHRLRRVLATSALSFDSSVFEIFAPLFCGGTIVLLESPLRICSLTTEQPRLLSCAPSVAASLLRAGWIPDSIESVVLAGEPVPSRLAAELQARLPGATLYNCYGLTEATVYSTAAVLSGFGWNHAPIGRPIANTQIYLLDEALRQVPIGVPGEIFIGGKGVARLYIGEPQLTAERFIHNPFGEGRLLRTGDWGRYRHDGGLVVMGRLDHQVKIRGLRVDLGEVESHLRTCSGIAQCVVTVSKEHKAGPQLVAYYTACGSEPSENEIREHLGKHVPAYMVPSRFRRLQQLPLNESGKISRSLLEKEHNVSH